MPAGRDFHTGRPSHLRPGWPRATDELFAEAAHYVARPDFRVGLTRLFPPFRCAGLLAGVVLRGLGRRSSGPGRAGSLGRQ